MLVPYKLKLCHKFMTTGACKRGSACTYAHGDHEIGMNRPPELQNVTLGEMNARKRGKNMVTVPQNEQGPSSYSNNPNSGFNQQAPMHPQQDYNHSYAQGGYGQQSQNVPHYHQNHTGGMQPQRHSSWDEPQSISDWGPADPRVVEDIVMDDETNHDSTSNEIFGDEAMRENIFEPQAEREEEDEEQDDVESGDEFLERPVPPRTSASGFLGVYARRGKWYVQVSREKKLEAFTVKNEEGLIKLFDSPLKAARVRRDYLQA